jgi:uncharacterized protein YkwD
MVLRFISSIVFLFFSVLLYAQNISDYFTDEQITKANTALNINYHSEEEKDVILITNLSRTAPKAFAAFLEEYISVSSINKSNFTKSLYQTLIKSEPSILLTPQPILKRSAKQYAIFAGRSGKVGHYNFNKRMQPLLEQYDLVSENCDYGSEKAIDIVFSLLIDEGIENLGHRNTILNPSNKYIGVSIQPHKKYKVNCVQHFGG